MGPCLRKAKGAPAVRVLRLRAYGASLRMTAVLGWVVAFQQVSFCLRKMTNLCTQSDEFDLRWMTNLYGWSKSIFEKQNRPTGPWSDASVNPS